MKGIQIVVTSAMECILSVCFQAWASVLEFSPELVAISFRSFVCWFFLNQFVGIMAVSDVEFEFVLPILMRNLVVLQVAVGG